MVEHRFYPCMTYCHLKHGHCWVDSIQQEQLGLLKRCTGVILPAQDAQLAGEQTISV